MFSRFFFILVCLQVAVALRCTAPASKFLSTFCPLHYFPSSSSISSALYTSSSSRPSSSLTISGRPTRFSTRSHSQSLASTSKNDQISAAEQKGIVTMYKKEGCPYCKKAIELLENKYSLRLSYVDIEGDNREEKLHQMRTFSGGRNTVPQIFFNSEHLGGNDDVQKLEIDGILASKVKTVRDTPVSMMMDHWYHPHY